MTSIDVTLEEVSIEVTQAETLISVEGAGPAGPTGATGPQGPVELYDSATPPGAPTFPYIRFERDGAGDPQVVYLGTVT